MERVFETKALKLKQHFLSCVGHSSIRGKLLYILCFVNLGNKVKNILSNLRFSKSKHRQTTAQQSQM